MADGMKQQMIRLYRDPALRRALANGARRAAERRSWHAELDRLEESYREVNAARLTRDRSGRAKIDIAQPVHAQGAAPGSARV
jgi:hypothetical protein